MLLACGQNRSHGRTNPAFRTNVCRRRANDRFPLSAAHILLESRLPGSALQLRTQLSTAKTSPNEPPVAPKHPVSDVELLSRAEHPDPFHILGPHITGEGDAKRLVVRAFLPKASEASVILEGHANPIPASRISPEGLFEAALPLAPALPISPSSYRWRVSEGGKVVHEYYDSYAFPALLSDYDLHLMGEGTHYLKYEKMGAHPTTVLGIAGVQFAVWAPNAMRVSVVGDFNQWDGRAHPMRNRGPSGVWELFVPELAEGAIYKYEIRPMSADLPVLKSDPYGFYSELRPKTGSIVARLDHHTWEDANWMNTRAKQPDAKHQRGKPDK